MLQEIRNFFRKKSELVKEPVTVSPIVKELLAGREVSQPITPEEAVLVDAINQLKGTRFDGSPGYILSVIETGSNMARLLGKEFDLKLLYAAMDGKVRRNHIPVNLNDPEDVDRAWERFFNEGN